jgi:hypothetical protein
MFKRIAQPSTKARKTSSTAIFPAPLRGLIQDEPLAKARALGAEVLDNFVPTVDGVRQRRGSDKHGQITDGAAFLTTYEAGAVSKMFAADEGNIYDMSLPADPDVPPSADLSGLTNGDWSAAQFTTAGGSFLMMVNGADNLRRFDGTNWVTITGVSSPAITGVATTALSHVWKFKSRLWFIQGGAMSAWYLGTNSVSGAATEFPLGSEFSQGGSLLFGGSLSRDAGDGPDDFCVFVTTEGEVVVYEGTDPASASTFAKVGVYKIGRPLHKNAHFKAGGDMGILTDDAIVSMLEMLSKDRAGLQGSAVTKSIEPSWRDLIRVRFNNLLPFSCVLWPAEGLLIIGIPSSGQQKKLCFVINTRTGAWGRFTGWDVRCLTIFRGKLYFGTSDGRIVQGEVTGADEGEPYTSILVPKFSDFGRPEEKTSLNVRLLARANREFTPQLFACADYDVQLPTPLDADADVNTNLWGVAKWGQFKWGTAADGSKRRLSVWQNAPAVGEALAPGLQITSGRVTAPDLEIIALHLVYESGEVQG